MHIIQKEIHHLRLKSRN